MFFTLIHRRYERTSALTRTSGKALGIALLLSAGLLSATCGEDSSTPSTPEPSTPSPPSPPPTPDDHGSERGSATQVGVPSDTPGVLTALDADYFRLSVDRSGILTVYTSGTTDTAGRLDDASGLLLVRDSDSGVGNNFRIEHEVSSGTYFIGIAGQTRSIAGGYTLHVRFSAPPADDHGNDRASATQVGAPSDTPGALTSGDTDYFRISVRGSGSLDVYTSGSTDTLGRLEDAGGSALASNDDGGSGNNFRIERDVSAGTYYIRVATFARSTTGNYTLHVRFAGLPEDDHGDYDNTATAVDVPSATRGELEHVADVDVFRFRLDSSGGRLTVETTGSTDVEGLLRGPNGLQERDDNSGAGSNFRIVVDNAPAGVYHAGVRGVGSGTTGRYELRVRVDRGPSDDHGNDRASATRVGVPSDTSGALTAGDTDFFRIDTNGSGRLEVYSSGSIDTVGRLEDAGGSSLAENDDSGSGLNFRIERDVSEGTYYVRVRGVSGSTAGDYTLHVRFRREDDSPSDLTIHSFSIYLSNGDTPTGPVEPRSRLGLAVAVRNIGRSASPPTVVGYYRSNDSQITRDDFRVAEDNTVSLSPGETQHLAEVVTAPSDPGTYYYGACADPGSRESDTSNNCSTGVRLDVGSAPRHDDHGDTESTATEITVPSTTRGELERPDDVDVFRFRLDFEPVRVTVYTTGRTDTVGEFHREGIFNTDDNSGDGLNFRIVTHDWFLPAGRYYVVYVRGNDGSTGPYELHVTADREPPPHTDDHGDTQESATAISAPSTTRGELEWSGDTDVFTFRLDAPGSLTVETTGTVDTFGKVFGPTAAAGGADNDSGQDRNFRIVVDDAPAGLYVVHVEGSRAHRTGRYELHVRVEDSPRPDDHGDSRNDATRVSIPSTTRGELEEPGDVDAFHFRLDYPVTRLTVETTGETDTFGRLSTEFEDGVEIGGTNDNAGAGENFRIVVEDIPRPVDVWVYVRGTDKATGRYQLHVTADRGPAPDTDDHGDNRNDATRVSVPSDTNGILTASDTDYFRVDVDEPGTLEVYTSGSTDTLGRLEGADGSRLDENDDGGSGLNFRIEREVSRGTYYIRVRGISGSTAGSYTLHVRFVGGGTSSAPDLVVSSFAIRHRNSNQPVTKPVEPGAPLELFVAVQNIGGVTSPATRVNYYLSTNATISGNDTHVGADDVISLGFETVQEHSTSVTAPASHGTYYYGACVRPVPGEPDAFNNCSVGVSLVVESGSTPPPSGDDHGDDSYSATQIDVPSDTAGVLDGLVDKDYFRFSLNALGTLEVYTTGPTDTVGHIVNERALTVATDNDSGDGPNFRIVGEVVATGTYYVVVEGSILERGGSYTLHVRFTANAAVSMSSFRISATALRPDTLPSPVHGTAAYPTYSPVSALPRVPCRDSVSEPKYKATGSLPASCTNLRGAPTVVSSQAVQSQVSLDPGTRE